jgi:hypothetical protein
LFGNSFLYTNKNFERKFLTFINKSKNTSAINFDFKAKETKADSLDGSFVIFDLFLNLINSVFTSQQSFRLPLALTLFVSSSSAAAFNRRVQSFILQSWSVKQRQCEQSIKSTSTKTYHSLSESTFFTVRRFSLTAF